MTEVGFGLGSNVGDKVAHLRAAARLIVERGIADGLVLSRLYRTAPWGGVEQDWFVNACAAGQTTLAPHALLGAVKALEVEIGRKDTVRWGPRVIDIDILWYGDVAVDAPDLVLPHREILRRAFVLVPLAEIRPDLVLAGRSVAEHAAAVGRDGVDPLEPAGLA